MKTKTDSPSTRCRGCRFCSQVGAMGTAIPVDAITERPDPVFHVGTLQARTVRCRCAHEFLWDGSDRFRSRSGKTVYLGCEAVRLCEDVRCRLSDENRDWEERLWRRLIHRLAKPEPPYEGPGPDYGGNSLSYLARRRARHQTNKVRRQYDYFVSGWSSGRAEEERRRAGEIPTAARTQVKTAWEAAGRICELCGTVVAPHEQVHLDHRIPLADGGESTPENLRPVHASCNLQRSPYGHTAAQVTEVTVTGGDLTEWRARAGLSQSQLAQQLGVDVRDLSAWEDEIRPMPAYLKQALEGFAQLRQTERRRA